MMLLDVNVVLPTYMKSHSEHDAARPWFDRMLARQEQFGIPWMVWHSVLRLGTDRRLFARPMTIDEGDTFIAAIQSQPGHVTAEPGPRHRECLRSVCTTGDATGKLIPDAVLAAIAVEHGATVVSFDRDFARFPKVTWIRPT